jgi:hypothetical protein
LLNRISTVAAFDSSARPHEHEVVHITSSSRHNLAVEEKRLNYSGVVQSELVAQQRKSWALYYRCESLPKPEHKPPP